MMVTREFVIEIKIANSMIACALTVYAKYKDKLY